MKIGLRVDKHASYVNVASAHRDRPTHSANKTLGTSLRADQRASRVNVFASEPKPSNPFRKEL